jgi:hypothetical protein
MYNVPHKTHTPLLLYIKYRSTAYSAAFYFSIFANFVYCGSHTRFTVPIGPFLCFAIMISEIPFISESWL